MALSVDNKQTYRLRDLRDTAVPRDRSEVRSPSRRPKFEDSLSHPKAGQVVGEFPAKYDKAPRKPEPKRNALQVAAERQRPRQAVAALMAKEGISTFTKFGRQISNAAAAERTAKGQGAESAVFGAGAAGGQPAWMTLLDDDKKSPAAASAARTSSSSANTFSLEPKSSEARAEAKAEERADIKSTAARLKRLEEQKAELSALQKFSDSIDGYSTLEKYMKNQDTRVLKEAGRLERASQYAVGQGNLQGGRNDGLAGKQATNMDLMRKEMAMNQQLNLQYLALQDKLSRGTQSLLSNLLKARSEATKNAISGG